MSSSNYCSDNCDDNLGATEAASEAAAAAQGAQEEIADGSLIAAIINIIIEPLMQFLVPNQLISWLYAHCASGAVEVKFHFESLALKCESA